MKISRWGEVGALCSLAVAERFEKGPIGALEISEKLRLGLEYTQQVLHRLRKGGVIISQRGPNGGFSLAKAPEATTLREVIQACEGAVFEVICDSGPIYDNCDELKANCGLNLVWHELSDAINQALDRVNLKDLLARHANFSPCNSCYAKLSHIQAPGTQDAG